MAGETEAAVIEGGGKIIGGTASGIGNVYANRAKRKGLRYVARESDKLADAASLLGDTRVDDLKSLYDPLEYANLGSLSTRMNDLAGTDLSKYDLNKYGIDPLEKFEFDLEGATQEEMNPYLNDIVDAATGDVTASAANAGGLFSGAAGKDIARATYDIRAKEQGAARERAIGRQNQKYQQYNDKFTRALQNAQFDRGGVTEQFNMAQGAYNTGANTRDSFSNQRTGITNTADERALQLRADAIAARGEANGTPGGSSAFLQGFGGAF